MEDLCSSCFVFSEGSVLLRGLSQLSPVPAFSGLLLSKALGASGGFLSPFVLSLACGVWWLCTQCKLCRKDPTVKLQLQAEERGVVSIKGVCANRYLAMKEDGRLLASKCVTDECFFFERLESNNYNTYRSRKYSSWYVALKRTGQYKLGPKTGPGQKAILFLPMSAKS
uniref:Fibroblast growth factor n=1 Tax=Sus scrofa TaxID=9823 RepID=A0A4X1VEN9_PIG